MLSSLLHVLGRSFGILMGWRRTHRPGDLTARIFIEHDRVLARMAAKLSAPKILLSPKLKSIKSSALASRPARVAVRAERIELISHRAVARIARTNAVIAKRDARRVVWLDISRNSHPISKTAPGSGSAAANVSNIVALHYLAPVAKALKLKAA